MPTISVIVPVYKVERYLDRCVRSILNQTFEDFELILVDDGSPDNCGAMCDAWAEKDSRIRVVHKPNGGLSDARNVGIDLAQGEWLTFVDSDDYLHFNMLMALHEGVRKHNVNVCVGGFTWTNGEPLKDMNQDWEAVLVKPAEFYRQDLVTATIACAKLYRKDCFVDLRYPKGKLHEDEFVTYRILLECEKIAVFPAAGYAYYRNAESITQSAWSPRRLDALEAFSQQIHFFAMHGYKELQIMRIRDYVKYIASSMDEMSKSPEQYAGLYRKMKREGQRFIRKNHALGAFGWEKDGWFLKQFFPGRVKLFALKHIILRKVGFDR